MTDTNKVTLLSPGNVRQLKVTTNSEGRRSREQSISGWRYCVTAAILVVLRARVERLTNNIFRQAPPNWLKFSKISSQSYSGFKILPLDGFVSGSPTMHVISFL